MKRVAIIGLSQSEAFAKLFPQMVRKIKQLVEAEFPIDEPVCLVSGGSSGADHVAVVAFLESKQSALHLYLPCAFTNKQYALNPDGGDWTVNPGKSLNFRHRQFGKQIGQDTLSQIDEAIARGAHVTIGKGFHDRNTMIAENCDFLVAFSETDVPTGGTLDTWSKTKAKKVCISVSNLL